jgi:hypothetical protein
MKIIILVIITASLNITLFYKDNKQNKKDEVSKVFIIISNESSLSQFNKTEFVESIKHELLNQFDKLSTLMLNILIKTHIITIKEANTMQNHSIKPTNQKLENFQKNQHI